MTLPVPPVPTDTILTISYGPEHAGSRVRLYMSLDTGGQATLPFTPTNAEKLALYSDGLVIAGEGFLDHNGKITFDWDTTNNDGVAQAAIELVGGWVLSNPKILVA